MSRFAAQAPPVEPIFQSLPVGSLAVHLSSADLPVDPRAGYSLADPPVGLLPDWDSYPVPMRVT